MKSTSDTFVPYADARYSNIRVSFRLIDTDASADATPSATNYDVSMSQIIQTYDGTEKMGKKWATLETDGWPLDGSCYILPDNVSGYQTGWWSNVSDADGNFNIPPTLTLSFASAHSSIGFTVFFDDAANQYPKSMTVTAYDASNAVLSTKTVTPISAKCAVDMAVSNYRKVVLSFSCTQKGYQSVRVTEVVFGIVQEFDKDNMTQGEILFEVAPRSDALPCGQLTITIDNTDHKYNMLSPNSLYAFLATSQPLDVELGVGDSRGNLEYVSMGRYYYAKSEAADDSMTAKIIANDRIYQLDKTTYRKGTNGTATVASLISAVLNDANIGLTANIPSSIGSRIIGSCIPIVSHREAIRMIAQAARCVAYINRDNKLTLCDFSLGTTTDTLDKDNMASYPAVSVSDRINTANISIFSLNPAAATESVYNATLTINGTQTVWIEYSDPTSSPTATVSGGVLNSGALYLYGALLNITANGNVTISVTGYKLSSAESVYTATNIQTGETEQPFKIQNKLITTSAMATDVATWVLAFSRITYAISERGNPARELIDTVMVEDAYGVNGNAVIIKEQYTFDGTLKCATTAVK